MFRHRLPAVLTGAALWLAFPSCTEHPLSLESFDPPVQNDGWPVSSPEQQGLDRGVLRAGFAAAARLPYSYSLLVVRHGVLVAEQYFNGNPPDNPNPAKSVSKSILSALTGIAVREGYLENLDRQMLGYFPEYVSPGLDPRKFTITIRHLLTMRAGFPDDEAVYSGIYASANWCKTTIELPLRYGPGEKMVYNTFEAHLLSAILTRASGMSMMDFARRFLCEPLGITIASWETDPQGCYFGGNGMQFRPRDLARFGLLYLRGGNFGGRQLVPREWVDASLTTTSHWQGVSWGDLRNLNYGYLWWMGDMNGHRVFFALGHGGQSVVCCPELDMVVVTTTNSAFDWDAADEHERAVLSIIAQYVLPAAWR